MSANLPRRLHLRNRDGDPRCGMPWQFRRNARFAEQPEQATCKACIAALQRAKEVLR